ncbi:MAG: cell division protein ZapA [Desulfobulbaceae bacterium]|nr:cell division protein ZapA [Desulfobulbaceae bacterium]
MERRVQFDLYGQAFSFYTDASEEEVAQVISLVRDELGEQRQGKVPALLTTKTLVLCCLKIADRYVRLDKEYNRFRNRQDESIDKLINKVSSGIDRENP